MNTSMKRTSRSLMRLALKAAKLTTIRPMSTRVS